MNPCEYDTVLVSSLEPSSARCWPTYLLAIQVSVFVNSPRCSFLDTFIRVFFMRKDKRDLDGAVQCERLPGNERI